MSIKILNINVNLLYYKRGKLYFDYDNYHLLHQNNRIHPKYEDFIFHLGLQIYMR